MVLNGSVTFHASREQVWRALQDPEAIAACLPGCSGLTPQGDGRYGVSLRLGIGSLKGVYSGMVRLSDIVEPTTYRMSVESRSPGAHIQGSGSIRLETRGETTIVSYDGTAQVAGPMAGVGHRLVLAAAKYVIGDFFKAMEQRIAQTTAGGG